MTRGEDRQNAIVERRGDWQSDPGAGSVDRVRFGPTNSRLPPNPAEGTFYPHDGEFSPTITLADAGNSVEPDRGEVSRGKDQQDAMGSSREDRKSTVPAAAGLLLRIVRDSADTSLHLKSVAGCLCNILENHEGWFTSQGLESLAPRIKVLAELLSVPVSEGDLREESRRVRLEQ